MKTYAAHLADCRNLLTPRLPLSVPVAASLGLVLAADIGRFAGTTVHVASEPGSHLIVGLARADCLVVVPEGVSRMAAGETVEVIPLQNV
jgi:MoeA C-terminal region (domain IV)